MTDEPRHGERTRGPDTDGLFDAIVIGTGFGGAVAACRLAEAKKKVCVLERGRRYGAHDFPRPAKRPDNLPHVARWAWSIDHGLWDVKDLQGALTVQAAGYGGGSLVYANVHLRAPAEVFATGWPKCYSRHMLDPFYDIVAAVLQVRPFPAQPGLEPPKLKALQKAAKDMGREGWFFRPPLAIDFGKCVMCGECIVGCNVQAKNTLDLNYLARAEEAPDAVVDVRTLAEVTTIAQDDHAYTVTYRDHVTGGTTTRVRATTVFLCAGAVHSTEILLRSRDSLPMADATKDQIGRRFFTNGDAIGMAYDTRPAPKPTWGPTITGSILYNPRAEGQAPGDWIMLQDGGYPKWAEDILGLFRGEFWLERNRVTWERPRTPLLPTGVPAASTVADARAVDEIGRALLGVIRTRSALANDVRTLDLRELLPPQIRNMLIPHLQEWLRDTEARHADTLTLQTMEEIACRVIASKPDLLQPLIEHFARLAKDEVVVHVPEATVEILHRYFLRAPKTPQPYTPEVLWPLAVGAARRLFAGQPPDDHAFVMLTMGIDRAPGELSLEDGELVARWDRSGNARFSALEERLMHDVADAMQGELRLNPDSISRQRPVTVHSLGGCAMSDDPAQGVTDANGRVWGTRALYVLDGAAIPTSLGANPSATIAAVAERNIRIALAEQWPLPQAPVDAVRAFSDGPILDMRKESEKNTDGLDPIGPIPPTEDEPRSAVVGLTFEEVMHGFYGDERTATVPIAARFQATIADLNAFLVDALHRVQLTGTVWLGTPATAYEATGTLELFKRAPSAQLRAALDKALSGARRRTLIEDLEAAIQPVIDRLLIQPPRYEMEYRVRLDRIGDGARSLMLEGVKRIYGTRPVGAWTETTTLYLTLHDGAEQVGKGTMHVHLADFLQTQLPSFRVTGTKNLAGKEDDIRVAWAYARFFRFFLGRLRQVYLPGIKMLDPFGDQTR